MPDRGVFHTSVGLLHRAVALDLDLGLALLGDAQDALARKRWQPVLLNGQTQRNG